MSKPIYIFKIRANYAGCTIYWGSRMIHNLLGTSTVTLDKGLTREERYKVIAAWLHEQTGHPSPSYRPHNARKLRKKKAKQ